MKRRCFRDQSVFSILITLIALSTGCFLKRPIDYEREYAKTLAPKKMEMTSAPAAGPRRTLKVRVYADGDYRKQVLHWERAIETQLLRASAVVEEPLGVRFALESARVWNRETTAEGLESALVQLEAQDPGEDVDLVIGYVSGLSLFTSSQHHLGFARIMGRHCVLRGMDNLEEANAILGAFQRLPLKEREEVYRERKLHKETSVLLHEWAHTLGAFHVGDSRWMMHPTYESSQGSFAPLTLELLALSLRHLPKARNDTEAHRAWAKELSEFLAQTVWVDWEGPEKAEVETWAKGIAAGQAPVIAEVAVPMHPADRKMLEEAFELEKKGNYELAAQKLKSLVLHYPNEERVQALACFLAVQTAVKEPATRERCDAVLKRFPEHRAVLMSVALHRIQNGHPEEAPPLLVRAQRVMEANPDTSPREWADLAGLYYAVSCITWAEQAARKAPVIKKSTDVLRWTQHVRRWMAMPADAQRSGISPDKESAFIRAMHVFDPLIGKGDFAGAQKVVKALAKEFPTAPGVKVLQCALKAHVGELPAARAACHQALAADGEAAHAHFLLGWMAAMSGAGKEARTHLERVIELVPTYKEAWRLLDEQYRRAGKTKELTALHERYAAQFAAAGE